MASLAPRARSFCSRISTHVGKPSDPPLSSVIMEGGKELTYTIEGARGKPVFIAIHGAPGTDRDFRWLAPKLADQFQVVRVNLPGNGKTALTAYPSLESTSAAEAVQDLITGLNLHQQPCFVLAHSIGATVATEVASRWPQHVHGVALVGPVSLRPHRALRPWWLVRFSGMAVVTRPLSWIFGPLSRMVFVNLFGFPRNTTTADVALATRRASLLNWQRNNHNAATLRHHSRPRPSTARPSSAASEATGPGVAAASTGEGRRMGLFLTYACNDPLIEPAVFREMRDTLGLGRRQITVDNRHYRVHRQVSKPSTSHDDDGSPVEREGSTESDSAACEEVHTAECDSEDAMRATAEAAVYDLLSDGDGRVCLEWSRGGHNLQKSEADVVGAALTHWAEQLMSRM